MKCLTLFLHAAVENAVLDCLRGCETVTGFTLSECQGHSTSTSRDPFVADRDRVVGFVPRVRIDIVLDEESVDAVLERLGGCLDGGGELGAWFLIDVLRSGRL